MLLKHLWWPLVSHIILFRSSPTSTNPHVSRRRAQELQEIVEQIDAASTFAKIGGFGRLIALVAPARRPEKVGLRPVHPRCPVLALFWLTFRVLRTQQ